MEEGWWDSDTPKPLRAAFRSLSGVSRALQICLHTCAWPSRVISCARGFARGLLPCTCPPAPLHRWRRSGGSPAHGRGPAGPRRRLATGRQPRPGKRDSRYGRARPRHGRRRRRRKGSPGARRFGGLAAAPPASWGATPAVALARLRRQKVPLCCPAPAPFGPSSLPSHRPHASSCGRLCLIVEFDFILSPRPLLLPYPFIRLSFLYICFSFFPITNCPGQLLY